jgi:type III secretory pathway component EscT
MQVSMNKLKKYMNHLLNMLIYDQTLIIINNIHKSTNTIYNTLTLKNIIFIIQLMFSLKSAHNQE